MKEYTFRGMTIPEHMMDGLTRYIETGCPTGDFLKAVLENNLWFAVNHADEENLKILPAYIGYLVNEAPSACWGSKEIVKAWITSKRIEREEESSPLGDILEQGMDEGWIEPIQPGAEQ